MVLIDSHSHLFAEEFDHDRSTVIERAAAAGIKYHILPNIDSGSTPKLLNVSELCKGTCFPLMGLHPTSVNQSFEKELLHVDEMLGKHHFYGIGEIGIDLYWDKTYIEQQRVAFRHQLQLAKRLKLPVVIHSRNAFEEIFEIVDQENSPDLRGVFHSFTGNIDQYKHIMGYKGFKVGVGGIVTYKHGGVDRVVEHMDIHSIVLETDSPYLSPVPERGQRNESYNLIYIAHRVAEIQGIPFDAVARQTTRNAADLFGIPCELG